MSNAAPTTVIKRDGAREPFDLAKLRTCLGTVLRASGYDPSPADPLARAVAAHVGEWRGIRPPSTDYVFRCVRSVLQQCGLRDVANELSLHRRVRMLKRKHIRVMEVFNGDRAAPWRKASVIAEVTRDFKLAHTSARFIAGQVESQVMGLKYRQVSKGLISEIIRNEVFAWGLGESVMANAPSAEL